MGVAKLDAEVWFRFDSENVSAASADLHRLRDVAERAGFELRGAKVTPATLGESKAGWSEKVGDWTSYVPLDSEPNDAKAVMRKMVEMFATGDLATLDSIVSTEYIDHQGIAGAEIRGREGFGDLVRAVHAPHGTPLRVTIEELIGEGDKAAARLHWHHTGEDGSVIERETIDLIRARNGLAVEHWGAETSRSDAG
jgi:predicted SnoaL-like aldol condensation-catalyzing enzyme